MKRTLVFSLLLVFCLLSTAVKSQRFEPRADFRPPRREHRSGKKAEFTFMRLRYGGLGWGEGWTTDYPKADEQFIFGLRRWCRSGLAISDDPSTVSFDTADIFKYPFIYAVEPGHMELSDEDAAVLREYLLRGGMLMLDDFWGDYEWQHVQRQMYKIFPERPVRELPLDHPVFHCYFDIDQVIQVPNYHRYVYRGITHEKGGFTPHYDAIVDDDNRVMVFIARNADNGDAWEWIDEPDYPLKYGLAAYRLGMNLIIYAMTH